MALIYFFAVLAVLVPVVLVPLAATRWAPAAAHGRIGGKLRDAANALVAIFGAKTAAVIVLLAGSAAVITICWPLGEALSRLEPSVDVPVFEYIHARRHDTWAAINSFYTAIGDRDPLKVVSVAFAVVFAPFWKRRWWIPVVAMLGQYLLEQYTQQILATVVDRGHPPTDLGTYPSGGCARVMLTFGTIFLLADLTWRIPRTGRVAMATVLALGVSLEGYTRMYSEKHWLTDVIGGYVFGALLIAAWAFALWTLTGRTARPTPPAPTPTAGGQPYPGDRSQPYPGRSTPYPGARSAAGEQPYPGWEPAAGGARRP
ncbi:phosphatase PAP2 family protein [Micromonospora sp. WMMD882]|uniref:phosphatase PAP2 family protein n=1 Tax=Micromonospora sp. WMMD882 TaxID=3015151 RepID=UPI00248AB89B|nr:phosphatase PAP2 family protein [Micromonospora sp. WMMD882]WBB77290.1 phosphatase PAP2 family protein [Micromonospora sp. WMMD882]